MGILIIGLVVFFAIHSVAIVTPSWRDRMVDRIGEWPWKGLYSVVALAGFVLIVWGYGLAKQIPYMVYLPPVWLRHGSLILLVFVFPLMLAAYFPGRIKAVTKHPMLAATKIWAFGHLLSNGGLADVVLFGSFLIWAVADRISLKRREQSPAFTAPQSKFNDAIAIVGGLLLWVVFVLWLHHWLFGVSPFGL